MTNIEAIKLNTYGGISSSQVAGKTLYPQSGSYLQAKTGAPDSFETKSFSTRRNPVVSGVNTILASRAPGVYIKKYINKASIESALNNNPEIKKILLSKGISPVVYFENVNGENQKHFIGTYQKAKAMSKGLTSSETDVLLQSALLHDIGKAFIPPEILNKPGKLTAEEREIVDTHAKLGAEILKTMTIDPRVVKAVELHHSSYDSPVKQQNAAANYLSVADVHDALEAKRSYKDSFPKDKIEYIMKNDKKLNQDIVQTVF